MHGACGATARDCRCATGGRRPDRTSAQPWTGRGMRRHDLRGRGKLNRETEGTRSEEHTSELQSLMRISYAVFCLKKKNNTANIQSTSCKTQTVNTNIYIKNTPTRPRINRHD